MPISHIDGCAESHWIDVLAIISDAAQEAGFTPKLVSNSDDSGIIQQRIIQNLYENPIAVCDVSCKNPNVMFELGIRLAFDKPTIVIKDDKTSYSFDTSPIEHLTYPRDLRFNSIVNFKNSLREKISATYARAINEPNYTTFLKNFGDFKTVKIEKKEVPAQEFFIDKLEEIQKKLIKIENYLRTPSSANENPVASKSQGLGLLGSVFSDPNFDGQKTLGDLLGEIVNEKNNLGRGLGGYRPIKDES